MRERERESLTLMKNKKTNFRINEEWFFQKCKLNLWHSACFSLLPFSIIFHPNAAKSASKNDNVLSSLLPPINHCNDPSSYDTAIIEAWAAKYAKTAKKYLELQNISRDIPNIWRCSRNDCLNSPHTQLEANRFINAVAQWTTIHRNETF